MSLLLKNPISYMCVCICAILSVHMYVHVIFYVCVSMHVSVCMCVHFCMWFSLSVYMYEGKSILINKTFNNCDHSNNAVFIKIKIRPGQSY